MRDAVVLGVAEPGEDALEHAEDLRRPQLADERPQRSARHVLHGHVRHAVLDEEVEQRDDVGMVERSGQPRLADEPAGQRGVVALEVELLQRDDAVERRLAGEVHDRHPAAGERPDDLVAADALAVHRIPGPTLSRPLRRRKRFAGVEWFPTDGGYRARGRGRRLERASSPPQGGPPCRSPATGINASHAARSCAPAARSRPASHSPERWPRGRPPRRPSRATPSRWASPRAIRRRTAWSCGHGSPRSRWRSAAASPRSPIACATSSPATRTSATSSATVTCSPCPTRPTASASSSTSCRRRTSTSTASRWAAAVSPVGRTRTGPPANAAHPAPLVFAFVSCQNFPDGYFASYAEIAAAADIETVIFLGDYIYEGRNSDVRAHVPAAQHHDARRLPDPARPVQDRPRSAGRARRASVARDLGRPRVRQQLRGHGPRSGSGARGGRGPPRRRLPCLLGAHAARAGAQAGRAGPAALPALQVGVDRHLQRPRRPPVPLRPAGLQARPATPTATARAPAPPSARCSAPSSATGCCTSSPPRARTGTSSPSRRRSRRSTAGSASPRGTWARGTTGTATSPSARCCSTGWSSTRPGTP